LLGQILLGQNLLGQNLLGQNLLGHVSFEVMRVLHGGSMSGLLRWSSRLLKKYLIGA
jgi:hypothetical protein